MSGPAPDPKPLSPEETASRETTDCCPDQSAFDRLEAIRSDPADPSLSLPSAHPHFEEDGSFARPGTKTTSRALTGWSGWLIGIACGMMLALWAFPRVRYTIDAQLQYALAADNVPWMRAMDSKRNLRERSRLDVIATAASDDYLIQVGRATALAEAGVRDDNTIHNSSSLLGDYSDSTLFRLYRIARDMPRTPGAYAHLARYMMSERIRIQRAELERPAPIASPHSAAATSAARTPARTILPRTSDVRIVKWALTEGEKHDPENAFWPAMLATTYFAAQQDDRGLEALARIRHKRLWDAYIYEEVLGQWRLYSAAYGDNGAAQKIGPLSLVAFPHLREIRRMVEMARWHAERAAENGDLDKAVAIRHNIAFLGMIMREKAQWAYEALYGTDLIFIASLNSSTLRGQSPIRDVHQWRKLAAGYLDQLQGTPHQGEIAWLQDQIALSCSLRQSVDVARYNASYPGIPPGIPLSALFGDWMAGICLLQQMLALILAALLGMLCYRRVLSGRPLSRLARTLGSILLVGMTGASGALIFFNVPSPRTAILFLIGGTLLLLLGMDRLRRLLHGGGAPRFPLRFRDLPSTQAVVIVGKDNKNGSVPGTVQAPDGESLTSRTGASDVESRWTPEMTWRMLTLLLVPGLGILYLLRPVLSSLHPAAVLLTSLMGDVRTVTPGDALELALLVVGLPLIIALAAGLWGMYRNISPMAGALIGLRRMTLPIIACLVLTYLALLNRTLLLDAQASRAIQKAAKNDLQWVLTHSETEVNNDAG